MKKADRTFYFFILISCAIHAMFWFGQFNLLTPIHTTGASNTSTPLQVTLIKPKQEQPVAKRLPKPGNPTRHKPENIEKPQTLKQIMVALKTNNNTKVRKTDIAKKVKINMEKAIGTTSASNNSPNLSPIQVNINSVITNISETTNFVIDPNTRPSIEEMKTLSQQQVARINAHLNQAFDQYFSYPRLAQRNGWQGMVKLGLRIESNGQLSHIRLLSTSGFPVLDQAALNTLNRISTLHDVDVWLSGLHFDTVLPVYYKLTDS